MAASTIWFRRGGGGGGGGEFRGRNKSKLLWVSSNGQAPMKCPKCLWIHFNLGRGGGGGECPPGFKNKILKIKYPENPEITSGAFFRLAIFLTMNTNDCSVSINYNNNHTVRMIRLPAEC